MIFTSRCFFLYSPYISLSLVAFQNRLWEKFGKHPRRVGLRHARSRVAPPCGVGGRPVHCYYFFVGQWSSVWHYMIIAMPRRTWIDDYCKKGRWWPAVNFLWRTETKELKQISLFKVHIVRIVPIDVLKVGPIFENWTYRLGENYGDSVIKKASLNSMTWKNRRML